MYLISPQMDTVYVGLYTKECNKVYKKEYKKVNVLLLFSRYSELRKNNLDI